MLKILLTFDYEIFFGKNYYSAEDILFEPTEKIVQILNENKIKGTFFADICSVFAHQKAKRFEYITRLEQQLLQLNEEGHDVQLHIHPHWLKSRIENGEWFFNDTYYRIHSFGFAGENSAHIIINNAHKYLESLLQRQDRDYKCVAFRAGGFCIQPYEELFTALANEGIIIDSSVAMEQKLISNVHKYDFSGMAEELNWIWRNSSTGSSIIEIPIGAVKNNLGLRILFPHAFSQMKSEAVKGTAIHEEYTAKLEKKRALDDLLSYSKKYKVLSLDSMHYIHLMHGLNELYKRYDCCNNDRYVAILCHPKCIDNGKLQNMNQLIREIKNQKDKYQFMTMLQVYKTNIDEQFKSTKQNRYII